MTPHEGFDDVINPMTSSVFVFSDVRAPDGITC